MEISVADTGVGMDAIRRLPVASSPSTPPRMSERARVWGSRRCMALPTAPAGRCKLKARFMWARASYCCCRDPRLLRNRHSFNRVAALIPSREKSAASRVLLVEDDLAVASLTVDMLEELGYEVVRVDSAHAGLTALAEPHRFDLVLSDVMMPGGMNGISFMRELRHRGIELPVVLVSGYAEAVRRGPENAGVPLLAKPYGLEDLAQILNAAMAGASRETEGRSRELSRAPDNSEPSG